MRREPRKQGPDALPRLSPPTTMSGERSDLIDICYKDLHEQLSSVGANGTSEELLKKWLEPRKDCLAKANGFFGKPSDASKKKIESGSVTLPDGVVVEVEEADKEYVLAASAKFQIDEVFALILLRSYLYNQGISANAGPLGPSFLPQLLSSISDFYFDERIHIFRVLLPLLRAKEDESSPIHTLAAEFLPKIMPDPSKFALSIVDEYLKKTKEKYPSDLQEDPKAATTWAKRNLREQVVLEEVLFWTMWGYAPCSGSLVEAIFNAAYNSNLGRRQANTNLLLDSEGQRLLQDSAALWIVLTVEVLDLETLTQLDSIELSDSPERPDIYHADPDSLERLHNLITTYSNNQFVCSYVGWAYFLSRLEARAATLPSIPPGFKSFLDSINPPVPRSYSKDRPPVHSEMAKAALSPETGLFQVLQMLLTNSTMFVTSLAWSSSSSVTDTNAIAYRSVLKGLLIAIVELVPVEHIPEFDAFVDVWISLFGRGESASVSGICRQYWVSDWHIGSARRAIFDVARSRFPIQFRPLLRLLRAMTGSGSLDTDPFYTTPEVFDTPLSEDREICDRFVYHYLFQLSTYSIVIPATACSGSNALYEKQTERNGSSPSLTYINLFPIRLPGGSLLPARSTGRLLSTDGGDHLATCWKHEHSGWKLILEILTDYVNRRRLSFGSRQGYREVSFASRGSAQPKTLQLTDVGTEYDEGTDEETITDALDLVRSVIVDNRVLANTLMLSLEDNQPVVSHTMTESPPPDLVQLTTMILEEALSRSTANTASRQKLITSAMSVLTALVAIPQYSSRVWLYIRSTSVLFGSDNSPGFASGPLAAERATGNYTMTLALLRLVEALFKDALLNIIAENNKLQQLKEEILLRAAKFVHTEIWVEHLGWKYTHLGDRFEIGRRVVSLYVSVFEYSPPGLENRPFALLSQTAADVWLFKATTSTINPLIASLSSGEQVGNMLSAARRQGDVGRLDILLACSLNLCRLVLNYKLKTDMVNRPSLLDQALCSRVAGGAPSHDKSHSRFDPIDVLARYIRRKSNVDVSTQAIRVLTSLASCLSCMQPSPPTIVGHLSAPEDTVASMVQTALHPYDEVTLRKGIWSFITLAVDKEPALATLFVTGKSQAPLNKQPSKEGKGKGKEVEKNEGPIRRPSALEAATQMIQSWEEYWDANPVLLDSVLHFLDVVWQHALEHKSVLEPLRKDADFWGRITRLACKEVGPVPTYDDVELVGGEGERKATMDEAIRMHAYRVSAKAHALKVLNHDIGLFLEHHGSESPLKKPESYIKLEKYLKDPDQLTDLLSEAAPSSYTPQLYDRLVEVLAKNFPGLLLQQVESQEPSVTRDYGGSFTFSTSLLETRLQAYNPGSLDAMEEGLVEDLARLLFSINLNLSLSHAETLLMEAWESLLRGVIPYLRTNAAVRPTLLAISSSISYDLAREKREGDMMATIYSSRLAILLALLEVAWFSPQDSKEETTSFLELVANIRGIILNEAQSPSRSLLSNLSSPSHRNLLQIIFFCVKNCRTLLGRSKVLNAEQRLSINQLIESALSFVIDGLRVVFVAAQNRRDLDLDRDMELLVTVFDQCTRSDICNSSTFWLARCQETDVIRVSLELYVRIDLVGLSDLPLLLSRKQPLYAPHILLFHMSLVRHYAAAERLASEGLLAAYSNNFITSAVSKGLIDVVLPELPGQRSPAHMAYCNMVSIVAGVIGLLGRSNHYFDSEACGFVQLYGDQISRTLSWTMNEPLTFPLLDELDQVVNLFYAIASSIPSSAKPTPVVDKVLRVFTNHALRLLQQINYAISHPNHLLSLFEPVTAEEKVRLDKVHSGGEVVKEPFVLGVVYRLHRLLSVIGVALATIGRAESVLLASMEDWPVEEALVAPHSKVVLGEPASLGTLVELGNQSLDLLRTLVQKAPSVHGGRLLHSSSDVEDPYLTPEGVKRGILLARRNIEEILLYAVTQLAMWVSKADFDGATTLAGESEMEDSTDGHGHPSRLSIDASSREREKEKERRQGGGRSGNSGGGSGTGSGGLTLAERLRRGMTSEVSADLQALLNKARAAFADSEKTTVDGKKVIKGSADLLSVLLAFLGERVGGSLS